MGIQLDKMQQQAVEHVSGPCLVFAGPGSGKTAVITQRLKYLTEQVKIKPEHILVITFTKASALEMQSRFAKETFQNSQTAITFGTFHAVYFHIIRQAFQYNFQNIITEWEKRVYLRDTLHILGLPEDQGMDFESGLLSEISRFKNTDIFLGDFQSQLIESEQFEQLYPVYQKRMRAEGKLDFDDMVSLCYDYLQKNDKMLCFWQEKYQYILVDEFQDCNILQYRLLRMIAGNRKNLFVVGDDDQSIYGFRGANPSIMHDFSKDYPEAETIILTINYRSGIEIVQMADQIIRGNTKRMIKKMTAASREHLPVTFIGYETLQEQQEHLIRELRCSEKNNMSMQTTETRAVICRTNQELVSLAKKLVAQNIPYYWKEEKRKNLYDTSTAEDLYAFFQLALGSKKRSFFLRIMNKPEHDISRMILEKDPVIFTELLSHPMLRDSVKKDLNKLLLSFGKMKMMSPFLAIHYLRYAMQYDHYLEKLEEQDREKAKKERETLWRIQEESRPFHTLQEWLQYCEQQRKKKDIKKSQSPSAHNIIWLLTMHGAKGLEFDHVWIPAIEDGNIPHGKHINLQTLEEERRIFYVAVTRAKHKLELYYKKQEQIPVFLQSIQQFTGL